MSAAPKRGRPVDNQCVGAPSQSTTQYRIDALLARLDRVRPAGPNQWTARCPAHEDRSPSLSIRDTGDRILIHCFAGCFAEDVLVAIGLKFADLYPDENRAAREAFNGQKRRRHKPADPLDHERTVLLMAAADLRAGKPLSIEDRARVELARERLEAANG